MTQLQCTAALVRAKCIPHCSVLLCKTGSQQACVTAHTPVESCSSNRCAVTQQQRSAALVLSKCLPKCSVQLCKTGSQHACVLAVKPMKIWSSNRFAVTQQQCSVALVLSKCLPLAGTRTAPHADWADARNFAIAIGQKV